MAQAGQTTLLEAVKKSLRISHAKLDDAEIVPLIEAAKKELNIAGVVTADECDPMIARAVTTYVKAHFGYDNPEAERFERIFNSIKSLLSQVGIYTTNEGDADAVPGGGLPAGGEAGQVVVKQSDADYDVGFEDITPTIGDF